jgi:hypothetical protein
LQGQICGQLDLGLQICGHQSEVDALTLEVLGSWEQQLNKPNEV